MNNIAAENTTTSCLGDRMERIYYLSTGIEVLSALISANQIPSPSNAEDVAHIIRAMAWELSAECAAVSGALDEHTAESRTA